MASVQQDEPENTTGEAQPSPECIRAELARILESAAFTATPRRRRMLKFLVEEMLAGRAKNLKGYTIGLSVFDRGESFDPQSDPVVRIEAHRLRRDLDGYYVSQGSGNPLRVSVPKGRYIPEITLREIAGPPARVPDPAKTSPIPAGIGRKVHAPAGSWMAAMALAFVGAAGLIGYHAYHTRFQSNAEEAMDEAPGVAVHFGALSGADRDSHLAGAVAGQVENGLSRFPDIRLFSISGEGTSDAALDLAKRAGVSFMVVGEVQSEHDSVRVTARLVDTQSAQIVWSETYDQELEPGALLAMQDEIATGVASTLGQSFGVIRAVLFDRLGNRYDPSMSSYECVLLATEYRRDLDRALHSPAGSCLQETIRREPEYAEVWALLAYTYFLAGTFGHVAPAEVGRTYTKAIDAANRALVLEPDNTTALKAMSVTNHYLGNFEESERYARLALDKHPQDPEALAQLGWRLVIRGKFEEGTPLLETAITRTLNPPGWYYHLVAIDRLMNNDGEGMLAAAKRSLAHDTARSYSLLAMAHGLLGNRDEARRALEKMVDLQPDYHPVESWRKHQATDEIMAELAMAARRAGWRRSRL